MTSFQARVNAEPYWFLKMDLGDGVITPGWSDPARDKLPYFGLPEDMSGLRVLDIGCAEGFFSFEAERRGAVEVVSTDFESEMVNRFALCAEALGSKNRARVLSIYDLDPAELGTFDLVMCFGLLYHLPDPVLAMRKVATVASGSLLIQSWSMEMSGPQGHLPLARFYAQGLVSGPRDSPILDPTVFWQPNAACIAAVLDHVGFVDIEQLPRPPESLRPRMVRRLRPRKYATWDTSNQFRAMVREPQRGEPPRSAEGQE